MSDIQKAPEHVNLTRKEISEHIPATGDIYISKTTYHYGRLFRLGEITNAEYGNRKVFLIDPETGEETGKTDQISESQLKEYYRPLLGSLDETLSLARKIVAGEADAVRDCVLGDDIPDASPEDAALVATRSSREIESIVADAERRENQLEEIKMATELIIENKRKALESKLDKMNEVLNVFKKKVQGLVRLITVLNLYTGRTVDLMQISDGDPAPASELLHLRQRILFMDEEICAHLDHEADYSDINLFLEWLKKPANRDIVIPEARCVVALKPKRLDMDYRSGDRYYDAQREVWNKHTYLVLRNGERLYVLDSEDLECFDWTFPHKDHLENFEKKMADPRTSFKDNLERNHKNENYRAMKFAMSLQGIIDNSDVMGPFDRHPNILKNENVVLVRDDEDTLGTGLPSFRDFQDTKNALLRRGKRVIYIPSRGYREKVNGPQWYASGDYRRWYSYENSKPEPPGEGIYSLNETKPGESPSGKFWFSYLPGGTVWSRNYWEDSHDRIRREGWTPSMQYILNYDDTSAAELQAYFDDRTKRPEFRNMMPILKRALLEKKKEEADEQAFIDLMLRTLHDEDCCSGVSEDDVRQAVAWWKEKVIFTRPLRSDDAKAWRMIKSRLLRQLG